MNIYSKKMAGKKGGRILLEYRHSRLYFSKLKDMVMTTRSLKYSNLSTGGIVILTFIHCLYVSLQPQEAPVIMVMANVL